MHDSTGARSTLQRAIAVLAPAAFVALGSLGCGDDGVKTATITEDNVLSLGLAASETISHGAGTANLLIQLGYVLPASTLVSPAPATAAPLVTLEPPDALCISGTSNVDLDESQDPPFITTTYTECALKALHCVVDGVVTADLAPRSATLQADDLDVRCLGVGVSSFTDESVVWTGRECDVDLNPFDSQLEDAWVKPRSLLLSGDFVPSIGALDAVGTTILSGEGAFDFETDLGGSVELGCPFGLPAHAAIELFGAGDSWGSIVFDDETCSTLDVCWWYGDMVGPDCAELPFPELPQ